MCTMTHADDRIGTLLTFCKYVIISGIMEKEIPILCLIYIERFLTKSGLLMNFSNFSPPLFLSFQTLAEALNPRAHPLGVPLLGTRPGPTLAPQARGALEGGLSALDLVGPVCHRTSEQPASLRKYTTLGDRPSA